MLRPKQGTMHREETVYSRNRVLFSDKQWLWSWATMQWPQRGHMHRDFTSQLATTTTGFYSSSANWLGGMLGNIAIIQKNSYASPRSISEMLEMRERRSSSSYPGRSLSGSVTRTWLMESYSRRFKSRKIRSSAERTAPPRSTHVQPGDVSSFLIHQGERRS